MDTLGLILEAAVWFANSLIDFARSVAHDLTQPLSNWGAIALYLMLSSRIAAAQKQTVAMFFDLFGRLLDISKRL